MGQLFAFLGQAFGTLFPIIAIVAVVMALVGFIMECHFRWRQCVYLFKWENHSSDRHWKPDTRPKKDPQPRQTKKKQDAKKSKHSVIDTFSEEYKLPQSPFN